MRHKLKRRVWIGQLGGQIKTSQLSQSVRERLSERLVRDHDCVPVFVPDAEHDGHYRRFCKEILWPTMHYILPDYTKSKVDEHETWQHYVAVNRLFCDAIVAQYQPGDVGMHYYSTCPLRYTFCRTFANIIDD